MLKQRLRALPPLHATPDKNVFVMMRYRNTASFKKLEDIIRDTLRRSHLIARFAKDARQSNLLWPNITHYMDQCRYGIAVFDGYPRHADEPRLNTNVCVELGYMLGKVKDRECLILRDESIGALPADLNGFVHDPFNGKRLETVRRAISDWIEPLIRSWPLLQGLAATLPESKFKERLTADPYAKLAIGRYIAQDYLPKHLGLGSLILDSGTTAASVAEAFLFNQSWIKNREGRKSNVLHVHTNNVLGSLILSSAKTFSCHLVPGTVDEDFAGVFGASANQAIRAVNASVVILACTSFTLEQGPHANSTDNLNFKRAIIDKSNRTVIVVTSAKIGQKVGKPVINDVNQWRRILKENIDEIVTSPGPEAEVLKRQLPSKVRIVQ